MRIIKRFSKTNFGQKFIGFLFYFITSFVYRSIRWTYIIESQKSDIFNINKGVIFCCWHNRLFLGPHILPKNRKINALQSSHSDGMVTSTVFNFLGMNVILGSSNKGGIQAFRKMVKCIQLGESIAITPDGPKGPNEKVKDGIIKLAQITNSPIIPLVWSTKKFKIISSWDRFIIPMPFSKGVYSYGEPIYVKKRTSDNEFEIYRLKLENEIKRLTQLVTDKVS